MMLPHLKNRQQAIFISLYNDPIYQAITSKLSAGCLRSGNGLSQFSVDELYLFHLSLFEITKVEKDMLLQRKLQVMS